MPIFNTALSPDAFQRNLLQHRIDPTFYWCREIYACGFWCYTAL